jgi:hypothetical protein
MRGCATLMRRGEKERSSATRLFPRLACHLRYENVIIGDESLTLVLLVALRKGVHASPRFQQNALDFLPPTAFVAVESVLRM